jgi:fumarate reductase flavoprotein subunit
MASGVNVDVIIVGAGGSGLAAAIEAARAGGRVVVLEKGDRVRGSTGWSVGSVSASGTAHQRRAGISDHVDHHFEDLGRFNAGKGDGDNLALRRILVDESADALRWLEQLGVSFVGPSPEPPHRVPRMHNVVPSSSAFGVCLERECARLGVEIRCGWRMTGLVMEDGRVQGVQATDPRGGVQSLSATRGVVLAAGDFSASPELKGRYFGPEVVAADPVNPLSTGDALLIAESVGARILNGRMGNPPKLRFVPAPPGWLQRLPASPWVGRALAFAWRIAPQWLIRPFVVQFLTTAMGPEATLFRCGAVLVDPEGRLVPIDARNAARHLPMTPARQGYIVFDAKCAQQLRSWPNFVSTAPGVAYAYLDDYRRGRPDIYREAASVEALAAAIGARADLLAVSLGDRNQGPWVALGPLRGYVTLTDGGLAVDTQHRVLGSDDRPIGGLYGAGSTGQGGLLIEGHGHHLGWAFVSGRRSGRSIMGTLET